MRQRYNPENEQPERPPRDVMGGVIPRWFSVILLACLTWFGKRYADSVDATLRDLTLRVQQVELWRASVEGRKPN